MREERNAPAGERRPQGALGDQPVNAEFHAG